VLWNARGMPRYVALLRGINVGRGNRVAMADLRRLTEALGHTEVATYIQSGNVLFASPDTRLRGARRRARAGDRAESDRAARRCRAVAG
jgi:uncharacterized protein (DUF1697 family)